MKKMITFILIGSLLSSSVSQAVSFAKVKDQAKNAVAAVTDKKFLGGAALALGLGYAYCQYYQKTKKRDKSCPTCGQDKGTTTRTCSVD